MTKKIGEFDPNTNEGDLILAQEIEEFQLCAYMHKLPHELDALDDEKYYDWLTINQKRREWIATRIKESVQAAEAKRGDASTVAVAVLNQIALWALP